MLPLVAHWWEKREKWRSKSPVPGSDTQRTGAGLDQSQSSSAICSAPSSSSHVLFLSQECSQACSLFQSSPTVQTNLCTKKSIFNIHSAFHKDEAIWFELGSWFWTSPYLDRGHSAVSFLTCMELWPLNPDPVTDCTKMPGCTLGESPASLRMWCTSHYPLTKRSASKDVIFWFLYFCCIV